MYSFQPNFDARDDDADFLLAPERTTDGSGGKVIDHFVRRQGASGCRCHFANQECDEKPGEFVAVAPNGKFWHVIPPCVVRP